MKSDFEAKFRSTALYQSIGEVKKVLWFIFWFSFAINLLVLALPIYTAQVLDRILSTGSVSTLILITLITIASIVCSALLEIVRSISMVRVHYWLDNNLAGEILRKAISFTQIKPNASSGQAMRDFNHILNTLSSPAVFSLFDIPWAFIYLIVIFMIHTTTGVIALSGVIILVLLGALNSYMTTTLIRENNETTLKNINEIDIASRNSSVLEAMGMVDNLVQSWCAKNKQNKTQHIKTLTRSFLLVTSTKTIRSLLQIAVIGAGAYFAISEGKSPGSIIASSILMSRTLQPFEYGISNWKTISSAKIAFNRIKSLLVFAPIRQKGMSLPSPSGAVSFDKVIYAPYATDTATIKGITFAIPAGRLVGIIGNSASGKSTIARLLTGVIPPNSGCVRLDGADVFSWDREHFGQYVGYMPQEIELFNATIHENISRMSHNPDSGKILEATQIIGAHDMILRFPNGYDTLLGSNGGVILSGGQKQLIGLCRAFYGDVRLLVLDEPNAHLDAESENMLINSLKYARTKEITTFIMTHKMSILSEIDIVIVLKEGRIIAMGERDEVLHNIVSNENTVTEVIKE